MHVITRRPRRSLAGFSLMEAAMAVAISSLILGAAGMFQMQAQTLSKATQRSIGIQERVERALALLSRELAGAGVSTFAPDPTSSLGSDNLTFQTPSSVSNTGVVTLKPPVTIALLMDSGEADNGLDDDEDGLVDERRLVVTRGVGTVNQKSTVICHGVAEWLEGELSNGADDNGNGVSDEHGFSVQRVGDLLYVRLTLETAIENAAPAQWTNSTAVVLHN
jgi:hypothetical protein